MSDISKDRSILESFTPLVNLYLKYRTVTLCIKNGLLQTHDIPVLR